MILLSSKIILDFRYINRDELGGIIALFFDGATYFTELDQIKFRKSIST